MTLRQGTEAVVSSKIELLEVSYVFLQVYHKELQEEAHIVARMQSMPNSQEHQCGSLRNVTVIQELQALVNIPAIRRNYSFLFS